MDRFQPPAPVAPGQPGPREMGGGQGIRGAGFCGVRGVCPNVRLAIDDVLMRKLFEERMPAGGAHTGLARFPYL
jgi:hypothetical protein